MLLTLIISMLAFALSVVALVLIVWQAHEMRQFEYRFNALRLRVIQHLDCCDREKSE